MHVLYVSVSVSAFLIYPLNFGVKMAADKVDFIIYRHESLS